MSEPLDTTVEQIALSKAAIAFLDAGLTPCPDHKLQAASDGGSMLGHHVNVTGVFLVDGKTVTREVTATFHDKTFKSIGEIKDPEKQNY